MTPTTIQLISSALFAIAILHTFSTNFFERLAHTQPAHAGVWHFLGEVEVVFGFWALVLILAMFAIDGSTAAIGYMDSRNFTEPMFVFAIMVIAGTRPILQTAMVAIHSVARIIPLSGCIGFYFTTLALVPLLGSFITEPAAMTLAALILSNRIFANGISLRLNHAGCIVRKHFHWGNTHAICRSACADGGWKMELGYCIHDVNVWLESGIAVILNALGATLLFRRELSQLSTTDSSDGSNSVPLVLVLVHLAFLAGVVVFAHHPAIFVGLFLFFLGLADAYRHHQDRLILREGLLVAFFLAGLVVLGGQQQWWLQPVLMSMSSDAVFFGATILTAFTDNAALTYLGSLVEGLPDDFKYALVAGAVTGGGLTIIANAPKPAGIAILRGHFEEEVVHPLGLLLAALPPTIIAALAFWYL
ncbi:putative Na+/H+ antiporter [Nitrosospira multiformis]|uniref:Putative Na+/H+ antiporter n=1 Tax=Nitrosospira multiformis TaxID=1231 RepID=A0A2T5HXU2_9PROT|nr:putative Na+/H+ antiporter [Nitrosospira multiformis]